MYSEDELRIIDLATAEPVDLICNDKAQMNKFRNRFYGLRRAIINAADRREVLTARLKQGEQLPAKYNEPLLDKAVEIARLSIVTLDLTLRIGRNMSTFRDRDILAAAIHSRGSSTPEEEFQQTAAATTERLLKLQREKDTSAPMPYAVGNSEDYITNFLNTNELPSSPDNENDPTNGTSHPDEDEP